MGPRQTHWPRASLCLDPPLTSSHTLNTAKSVLKSGFQIMNQINNLCRTWRQPYVVKECTAITCKLILSAFTHFILGTREAYYCINIWLQKTQDMKDGEIKYLRYQACGKCDIEEIHNIHG